MRNKAVNHRQPRSGGRSGQRTTRRGWAGAAWVCGLALLGAFAGARPAVAQPPGPQVPVLSAPGFFPPGPALPQAQDQAKNKLVQPIPVGPMPRQFGPFIPDQARLQRLPGTIIGTPPRPSRETLEKYSKFVRKFDDPEVQMELVVGRTRLMELYQVPKRVQIADDSIASYTLVSPKDLSLIGRNTGITVLTLWFADPKEPTKETILIYHVNVVPDPGLKKRLEDIYKALGDEINCAFPDSVVCLQLVGDKLVVNGWAHDIYEATQILRIVRANFQGRHMYPETTKVPVAPRGLAPEELGPEGALAAPGTENYLSAGGPNVINNLKVPGEQQVCLKVTVAEVNRAAERSIGLNFSVLNSAGKAVFANNTGSISSAGLTFGGGNGIGTNLAGLTNVQNTFGITPLAGLAIGAGGYNNLPAALDNGQVRLAISALRTLELARSLAEPNLVTMNGMTATFLAGGEFPVPVVTGFTAAGLQGVQFVPYGVQLNFTPYITDRDRIRLVMYASISTRDLANGVSNIGGSFIPNLTTRNFQTTVELREGQTLAVAGLIQQNMGADAHRVPFIGDVPILNNLLGFSRTSMGEQELVVLVTPELVHPLDYKEVSPLPGSDMFEANDLEFYVLGRLESHYPVDYRSTVRTDWERIHAYRRMEGMYLAGPHGHGGDH